MYIFDPKFKRHPYNYIGQSLLAIITIIVILLFLDVGIQTALIASLGATAFTVFSRPNYFMSTSRTVFGGYIAGITSGLAFDFLSHGLAGYIPHNYILIISGGCAVGTAIFIMVLTNTEHAPAAGIALGLTLNEWNIKTLLFILGAVVFMLFVRKLLKPVLVNLIGTES